MVDKPVVEIKNIPAFLKPLLQKALEGDGYAVCDADTSQPPPQPRHCGSDAQSRQGDQLGDGLDVIQRQTDLPDLYIYDISSGREASSDALRKVHEIIALPESQRNAKSFIAISTILTWARTPKDTGADSDNEAISIAHESKRQSHPAYWSVLLTERKLMRIGRVHKVPVYILWPGMLYGGDGSAHMFGELFQALWHSPNEGVSCPVDGLNVLPMVHQKDFVDYILDLCFYRPSHENMCGAIVVDDAHCTLFECIQVMCDFLSNSDGPHIENDVVELAKREWAIKGTIDLRMERTSMLASDGSVPQNPRDLEIEAGALLPDTSLLDITKELDDIILCTRGNSSEESSQQLSDDGATTPHNVVAALFDELIENLPESVELAIADVIKQLLVIGWGQKVTDIEDLKSSLEELSNELAKPSIAREHAQTYRLQETPNVAMAMVYLHIVGSLCSSSEDRKHANEGDYIGEDDAIAILRGVAARLPYADLLILLLRAFSQAENETISLVDSASFIVQEMSSYNSGTHPLQQLGFRIGMLHPMAWHCKEGFVHNFKALIEECSESQGYPLSIVVIGPDTDIVSRIADQISSQRHISRINLPDVMSSLDPNDGGGDLAAAVLNSLYVNNSINKGYILTGIEDHSLYFEILELIEAKLSEINNQTEQTNDTSRSSIRPSTTNSSKQSFAIEQPSRDSFQSEDSDREYNSRSERASEQTAEGYRLQRCMPSHILVIYPGEDGMPQKNGNVGIQSNADSWKTAERLRASAAEIKEYADDRTTVLEVCLQESDESELLADLDSAFGVQIRLYDDSAEHSDMSEAPEENPAETKTQSPTAEKKELNELGDLEYTELMFTAQVFRKRLEQDLLYPMGESALTISRVRPINPIQAFVSAYKTLIW